MTLAQPNLDVNAPVDPASRAATAWTTRKGLRVNIRPIAASDEKLMEQFHRTLSPDSVYRRYFSMIALGERIRHSRLDHICHPDPREEIVLVAETWNEVEQHEQIVAVARISNAPNATTGELAVVVADAYQGQGIGTELVRRLFDAARRRGLRHIRAEMMADNFQMRRICTRSGMQLGGELCADEVTAYVDL